MFEFGEGRGETEAVPRPYATQGSLIKIPRQSITGGNEDFLKQSVV